MGLQQTGGKGVFLSEKVLLKNTGQFMGHGEKKTQNPACLNLGHLFMVMQVAGGEQI